MTYTDTEETYIVALHNKLTGERGVLGLIAVPASQPLNGLYNRAELFPRRIAARAVEFRKIKGERRAVLAAYGPEIE